MVSSKCLKTSSPSPLRFLAALMPPWAQTEWERLTGTMEKRSTLPPASAILMTAASPAKPPPTTMILGAAIVSFQRASYQLSAISFQQGPKRELGTSGDWRCEEKWRRYPVPKIDLANGRGQECNFTFREMRGDACVRFVVDV